MNKPRYMCVYKVIQFIFQEALWNQFNYFIIMPAQLCSNGLDV